VQPAALIIMAKQPQVGQTKTRLCPPFSLEQAAGLYQALLRDTIALAAEPAWLDLAVAITPAAARPYFEQITPPGTRLLPVAGPDIGVCLQQALGSLLQHGYSRVLALNADGPTLPAAYLQQAFELLQHNDLVLGPGHDGGYYLVGLKRLHRPLFQDIAWSTPQVLPQTLERAAALGLQTALAPVWYDVDTPDDLQRLLAELQELPDNRLVFTRAFLAQSGLAGQPG
jgi:rSAM/selenodomain-associated transferase 1